MNKNSWNADDYSQKSAFVSNLAFSLVDILDEMAICKVPTNAIVNEFSPEENKLAEELNKGVTTTP